MNRDLNDIFKYNEIIPNISLNSSISEIDSILQDRNYTFSKERMDNILNLYTYFIEYSKNRIQILIEENEVCNIILEVLDNRIFFTGKWISSKIGIDSFVEKVEKRNYNWEFYNKYCVGRDIALRINNVLVTLDYSEKSEPFIRRIETPRSIMI